MGHDRHRAGADAVYAVLEAAPSPMLGVDAEGRIDYANTRAETVFGYRVEELVGRPIELLVPEDDRRLHAVHRAEFAARPRVRALGAGPAMHGRRKDGSLFPAEISLIPLTTGEGPWVVVAVADVTARRRAAERLEDIGRAYLTLAQVNQAIVRAPDELTLYADTCRLTVEQGGYLGAWVATADEHLRVRRVASAGALDDYIDRLDISLDPSRSAEESPIARDLVEGRTWFSDDFLADPLTAPWHELAALHGIGASATLPLRRSGRTVAILTLYAGSPHVFDEEVRALLATVGENVSFALERLESAGRLETLAAQRRELSRRLIAAEEEERARIAADVHDDSVQALAAVGLRLGLLRRQVFESAPDLAAGIEEVQRTVGTVTAGLRDLLFDLEAGDTSAPLVELLREAADHLLESSPVRYSLEVDLSRWDHASVLSESDRGQALRIFKEALFEVRRHGRARNVVVRVVPDLEGVEIAILDDGSDAAAVDEPSPRWDIATLRDRAEVSGGWCRVAWGESGRSVRFWMPYDPTAPPFMGPTY